MKVNLNLFKQGNMMFGLNLRDYKHCWGLVPMMFSFVVGGVYCTWYSARLLYACPDVEIMSNSRPMPYENQPQSVRYRSWTNLDYNTIKNQSERQSVGEIGSLTARPRQWNKDAY
uniref:Uncharacterized protein n=1 Tax=Pinctada fucata TaxID=50426 RepID=A0A194ALV8_PINFU